MNEHKPDELNDSIDRELTGLPDRTLELGAIERIEDALAAEAVLGPAYVEPKPGLLARRVPVWGMLAASVTMAVGAGVLGWVVKPAETADRTQVVTEPAPAAQEETPEPAPVVEVVRLERPLFERRKRGGIDPSRWTMSH